MRKILLVVFCLSFFILGCSPKFTQQNSPITNEERCFYGENKKVDYFCKQLVLSLTEEYRYDSEIRGKLKKLFNQYDAEIIHEFDADPIWGVWYIKLDSEDKMFKLKNELEEIQGVVVQFDFIMHLQ